MLTFLFGKGAAITAAPVHLPAGETFFFASTPLKPVDDTMGVGIELGAVTEDKKRLILSGSFGLEDTGKITAEVCKSASECLPMAYSGPYYTKTSFGVGFDVKDSRLKGARVIGVKVSSDRPLDGIIITWSNYLK